MDKKNINKDKLYENLKFFSDILKEIEHFVFFGTLLGLTRDNNLIDGDDDIDFYVDIKNREKIIKILDENNFNFDANVFPNNTPYFLQVKRGNNNEQVLIDFYFYENNNDDDYIYDKWNFGAEPNSQSKILKIPKIFIYPVKFITFENIKVYLPKYDKLVCEYLYGSTWKKARKKNLEYKILVSGGRPHFFVVDKKTNKLIHTP